MPGGAWRSSVPPHRQESCGEPLLLLGTGHENGPSSVVGPCAVEGFWVAGDPDLRAGLGQVEPDVNPAWPDAELRSLPKQKRRNL
jgi:hypothetical protein